MLLRPARPEDTEALVELSQSTGVFKPHELEVLRDLLDEFHGGLAGEDHFVTVAEIEGSPVGYTYFAPDVMTDGTWYLYWIAVLRGEQGRGIGAGLVRQMEEEVNRREGRLILIETTSLPHSEATRTFYLRMGYALEGVIRDFYSDGDDMVIFRKRLRGKDRLPGREP
ncbi:MAG: N-acetyltransferase family protein [Gemmataceae bacterium]